MDPLRHHILEAVECLRLRKCRPDRESIAHYVLRKFGSTMNEIFAELENIVDEGGLIKVEYKGTISYRNPESFDTKNSPLLTKHSKILNSSKTTRLIVSAINELLVKDPVYAQSGVPLDELREKLVEFDSSRFADESMHIVLEREISCGGIHMGKANYLTDSFRVFPKDLPIPADMQVIISLNVDNSVEVKEEKKIKKPRKSLTDSPDVKKPRKSALKPDLETEDIEEDDELEQDGGVDDDMKPPSRKGTKLTPLGRKIVAEKVAEAVRKSYESTAEFETTSAQMFKLAQTVVNKQVEQPLQIVEQEIPKGPSLVLASSIDHSSSEQKNNIGSVTTTATEDTPSNGEKSKEKEDLVKSQDATTINDVGDGKKRRGRPSVKRDNGILNSKPPSAKSEDEEVCPTPPTKTKSPDVGKNKSPLQVEEGLAPLTRSKREKRKKQVFDPSDTYSRTTVSKKTRLSETLLTKKCNTLPASVTRGRKSLPVRTAQEPTLTQANLGRGNLKRKRNSSSVTNNSTNSSPNSKNKLDSSVSDGSSENEVEDKNSEKKISLPIIPSSPPPAVETKPVTLICSYCQNIKKSEEDDTGEDFLSCSSCHANFHRGCLKYSKELTNRIREYAISKQLDWQCIECKNCGTCHEKITKPPHLNVNPDAPNCGDKSTPGKETASSSSLEIVLCETCDVGFHAKCTGESFEKKENEKPWTCSECRKDKKENSQIADTSTGISIKSGGRAQRCPKQKTVTSGATKIKVPLNSDREDAANSKTPEPPHLFPDDLRLWSKEDVEKFFIRKGLREEAANLLRQEVDGYSLLLLQREDIVSGMNFRLGPALKVFRLIHELQLKAPVQPHSSWTETEGEKTD